MTILFFVFLKKTNKQEQEALGACEELNTLLKRFGSLTQ